MQQENYIDSLKEIKRKSFLHIFLFSVFSFGIYFINWFYINNKFLEKLGFDAPNANRAVLLLFVFPFSFFFINLFLKFFLSNNNIYLIFEKVIWILIYLLLVKYFYDFSVCFSKFSKSSQFVWFFLLLLSLSSFLGFIFNFPHLYFLVFFFFVTISSMQSCINSFISKEIKKNSRKKFYY